MRILTKMLAAWGVAFAVSTAPAAVLTIDYVNEYSGGTPPAGAPPWLRATFDDGGASGSVNLTFTALNLVGSEFVNAVYFNLDPALNPNSLVFSAPGIAGSFASPAINTGVDAFSAGGATKFDVLVDFANAPPGNRFGPGDSVTYTITGIPTLTANSFNFLSVPGGHGPFLSVAKVQGIGPQDESGWVEGIPEPAALSLLAGAAVLLMRRRVA